MNCIKIRNWLHNLIVIYECRMDFFLNFFTFSIYSNYNEQFQKKDEAKLLSKHVARTIYPMREFNFRGKCECNVLEPIFFYSNGVAKILIVQLFWCDCEENALIENIVKNQE